MEERHDNNVEKNEVSLNVTDTQAQVPTINFKSGEAPSNLLTPSGDRMQAPGQRAGELVERAFEQAVVSQVVNNGKVQDELLKSAEQVVHSKTSAIKSAAEMEDKTIHFNNKKGACECFGYNETTTEKWAVNYMNVWHNIMTAIWVTVGMVTFAPVTFVAKKIKVIFKASWVAILLAIIIYFAVVTSPIWGQYFVQLIEKLMPAKEVAEEIVDNPEIVDPAVNAIMFLFR